MFDRSRRARLLLALLVTASLLLITIDLRSKGDSPLDAVGRFVVTVLSPIQEGLAKIGRPIGNFVRGFTEVPSLRARVEALEQENAALQAQMEQQTDVFRENKSLRNLLGLRDRLDLKTVSAQVIGIGPSNFERTLFIDRGTTDGIRLGMPVIGGAGLVGRVIAAGPSSSEVLLIVDRSSSVAGRLSGSGETGILEGTGGATLRFEILNPAARVKAGDRIVTSGYDGGVYPAGVPVGVVTEVPVQQGALSRVVSVRPFVNFTGLDYLLLVVPGEGGS